MAWHQSSTRKKERFSTEIGKIQDIAFEAGITLAQSLFITISTKIHRIMHHVTDHILDHGCTRRGSTDVCEMKYTTIKASYAATNKQSARLGTQLIIVQVPSTTST